MTSAGRSAHGTRHESVLNPWSTIPSAEFIRDQKAQTDILVYFMLGMAVMIAIVGGLGLMGTMSINVLERTREIGVMRAVGASNGDIQGIVIVYALIATLDALGEAARNPAARRAQLRRAAKWGLLALGATAAIVAVGMWAC